MTNNDFCYMPKACPYVLGISLCGNASTINVIQKFNESNEANTSITSAALRNSANA